MVVVDAVFATVQGPRPATLPRHRVGHRDHHPSAGFRKIAAICDAAEPIVVPKFRDGDLRAASCTIEPAKNTLHWRPKWTLEDGLHALRAWRRQQPECLWSQPITHMYLTVPR